MQIDLKPETKRKLAARRAKALVLDRDCPTCGAKGGFRCLRQNGKPRHSFHLDRWKLPKRPLKWDFW